jgi:DMSO reductase anchor subunit
LLALFVPDVFLKSSGWISLVGWGLMQAGLAASTLHLGRPLGAWRAFLGWKTSWMSREILVFGAFAGVATIATIAANWPWIEKLASFLGWPGIPHWPWLLSSSLMMAAAMAGLMGVFCSAMIYIDTRRAYWKADLSFGKFFGNTVWLGASLGTVLLAWLFQWDPSFGFATPATMGWLAAGLGLVLFFWDNLTAFWSYRDETHPVHESIRLIVEKLGPVLVLRALFMITASVLLLVGGAWEGMTGTALMTGALVCAAGSQLIERFFYFVAVRAPRMPGTSA